MKLIAKEKDYWDFKLTQWKDTSKNVPTWLRVEKELEVGDFKSEKLVRSKNVYAIKDFFICRNKNVSTYIKIEFYTLFFCGYSYPLLKVLYYDKTYNYNLSFDTIEITKVNFYYSSEDFKQSKDYYNIYTVEEKSDVKSYYKHSATKDIQKFLDVGVLKSIPLITGIYDFKTNKITTNILLKRYAFFNVMKADEVFKEIETYVNYTCNAENAMIVLTDQTMLKKRGFNEQSFKKRSFS